VNPQPDLFTPPAVQSTSAESLEKSKPHMKAQHDMVWTELREANTGMFPVQYLLAYTSMELARRCDLDRMLCSRALHYLERAGRVRVVTTRPCRITGRRAKAFVAVK